MRPFRNNRGGAAVNAVVLIGILVGFLGLRMFLGRSAPIPSAFDPEVTLNDALLAAGSDRVVLVLATADWCPPCQQLKRGPLAEQRVTDAILARTIPVYADATNGLGAEFAPLEIGPIPTMIALRDGVILSRSVGYLSADALIEWLDKVSAM